MNVTISRFPGHIMVVENFSSAEPAAELISTLGRLDMVQMHHLRMLVRDLYEIHGENFGVEHAVLMQSVLKLNCEEISSLIKYIRKTSGKRLMLPTEKQMEYLKKNDIHQLNEVLVKFKKTQAAEKTDLKN